MVDEDKGITLTSVLSRRGRGGRAIAAAHVLRRAA